MAIRRENGMTWSKIDNSNKLFYSPDMNGDPLHVQKASSHFSESGKKDFVSHAVAYEQNGAVVDFSTSTFRGNKALVKITFINETVFRVQMFPGKNIPTHINNIFEFKPDLIPTVAEDDDFVNISSDRIVIKVRKCPWEIIVLLDNKELTREQIKDFNVDQKYKAVPIGFSYTDDGKILNAFETLYMHVDEDFYGFGERFTDFNKRGQKFEIWQRDAQSTNSDVSYKGMPYFMSTSGYSILLNTFTRTHFNMGGTSGVSYTMETEDPYLDYYMFCNRDYKGLLTDYTNLSGRSPMIPRWAFGFWMSKMSYLTRKEVEDVVQKMDQFGMSHDVIHIDGWLDSRSKNCSGELLEFDRDRFPDPEDMIKGLREKGVHLSLWMFPYVEASVLKKDGPREEDYRFKQYGLMAERGFLVKNSNGEPYIFSPGEGDAGSFGVAALDFTNPEFVRYMKERVKKLIRLGVGVIKTDFSEEIPEDAVFYDGSTGLESHNKYCLLYEKTIYEASQEAKAEVGERALLWGRSGYAGSQNYPANWAGDSSAAKNNLASILNGGLSIGLSGVSFWGFDIGGFYNCDYKGSRSMPDDEDYIRSVQMGLMAPLSRSHGQATPREPWNYSDTAQKAFLYINKLRYKLLPYIYSTAYETHYFGFPMMRAMLLEFQEDLNTRNVSRQYMYGDSLLVAPVFDQEVQHVYLPKGNWIDYYTGKRISGNKWIEPNADINRIPLYIRENRVITELSNAPMHIDDKNFDHLTLIANLTDAIKQNYYDDEVSTVISIVKQGGTVVVEAPNLDVEKIVIYVDERMDNVLMNNQIWNIIDRKEGRLEAIRV